MPKNKTWAEKAAKHRKDRTRLNELIDKNLTVEVAMAFEQLEHDADTYVHSDVWQSGLDVASRFALDYSPSNIAAIMAQKPDATLVAGDRTWAAYGGKIKPGEKRISIFVPWQHAPDWTTDKTLRPSALYETTQTKNGTTRTVKMVKHPRTGKSVKARVRDGQVQYQSGTRLMFRVGKVLDISQIDGAELPIPQPTPLTGDAAAELTEGVRSHITGRDWTIQTRPDVPGRCGTVHVDHATKMLALPAGLSADQQVTSLLHGAAHIELHGTDDDRTHSSTHREVEANSLAYLVSKTLGFDTRDHSLPSLATWANPSHTSKLSREERVEETVKVIRASSQNVIATAHQVLQTIVRTTTLTPASSGKLPHPEHAA